MGAQDIPTSCRECESTDLSWTADTVAVPHPEGPHLTSRPRPRLVLGCSVCSATVALFFGDEIAAMLATLLTARPLLIAWEQVAPLVLGLVEVDENTRPDLAPLEEVLVQFSVTDLRRVNVAATQLASTSHSLYRRKVVEESQLEREKGSCPASED